MHKKLYHLIHDFIFNGPDVSDMNLAEHLITNGVTIPGRCKDCQSFEKKWSWNNVNTGEEECCGYCWNWDHETGMSPNQVDGDDFCSYGERRTDE